jgi:hypothetical protein
MHREIIGMSIIKKQNIYRFLEPTVQYQLPKACIIRTQTFLSIQEELYYVCQKHYPSVMICLCLINGQLKMANSPANIPYAILLSKIL